MKKPFPTPYPELNRVLRDLVDSVQAVLSNNFVGAYLQGSFAVGDFDLYSDVDFIMVIEEELSHEEVHGLQAGHERIYGRDIPWAQHLEGSYFPKQVLRDHACLGRQLWYLDNGSRSLIPSDHCNTVLVRWVVREHGMSLPMRGSTVMPMNCVRSIYKGVTCANTTIPILYVTEGVTRRACRGLYPDRLENQRHFPGELGKGSSL